MEHIGGDWTQGKGAFRGYPISWIIIQSYGVEKLGTGRPGQLREVHVDLSAGIVCIWSLEKVRAVIKWINEEQGHVTRIDCALDDRAALVPISVVKAAVDVGQCVTRARRFQTINGQDLHQGTSLGETLYFGSPQSETILRVYDKRAELQQKNGPTGRKIWGAMGSRVSKASGKSLCRMFGGIRGTGLAENLLLVWSGRMSIFVKRQGKYPMNNAAVRRCYCGGKP